MGVKVGDNTKIGDNNAIGDNASVKVRTEDNSWFSRHPWVSSMICSFLIGFLLMFSFWSKIKDFIEGLFK